MNSKALTDQRKLNWEALDDKMKMELLRKVVREQISLINRLGKLVSELLEHEHVDGRMLTRMKRPYEESSGQISFPKYLEEKL